MAQLKDWGLDAIECYYPKYTPEQQTFYLHLAEKYRLKQSNIIKFRISAKKVKKVVDK